MYSKVVYGGWAYVYFPFWIKRVYLVNLLCIISTMSIEKIIPLHFNDILAGTGEISLLTDDQLMRLCEVKQQCEEMERDYAILYYKPFPHQEPFHKSQKKVRMVFGSNQCLGGEQEIYDPVLKVSRRVDKIDSDFHVESWDGEKIVIAEAHRPFTKSHDDLYRFELSNGQSIVASMSHRVLTSHGYKSFFLSANNNLFCPYSLPPVVVTSVVYLRYDVKYDFEVPIYHNYCAGGIVHHNSGKSICSTAEGIKLSLGIHPYRKIRIPNKGRVVANDIKKGLGEVICSLYNQFLPMSEVKRIKKYPGGEISKVEYRNGSAVDFLTYEQDTKAFEGWTGDWAQWDEPMPRDKYIATLRGLMRWKGITWGAMTPLSEPWIYDEIYTCAGPGMDRPDIFNFDITDNPTLSPEEVADFASKLTEDEKEARLHGRFKHLSGLVFKELRPDIHFVEPFDIPKDWTRYCAMDYHSRMPCAMVWIAVDPRGTCYAYDELWIDKTVKEICEVIKVKEGKDIIRARFIDSISATPDRITGTSPQREFARHSLHFRSSTKNWILGLNACREYLKLDKEGHPGIYFMRQRTDVCIKSMERYQWDEYSNNREGEKEQAKKKFAHFPDAVRYILVMRPTYLGAIFSRPQLRGELKIGGHNITGYSYGAPD